MIIRPLSVLQREEIRRFYIALSAEDRRMRFCCSLSDTAVSRYVDSLNFTRGTIVGAFDEVAQLIGLGELAGGPEECEMAFSVRPDMRGQRIGTRLLVRLIIRACVSGVRKVFVVFLAENTPMRKMANRAGMLVQSRDGEAYASKQLASTDVKDLAHWFVAEELS